VRAAARRTLRVAAAHDLVPGVREVVLVAPDGTRLSEYAPGSHVVVTAGPLSNAYSLTGDGLAPRDYRISVLRRAPGGGSDLLHRVTVGTSLDVEGPACGFAPDLAARKALLVAAGIGVTPVLSHARAAAVWGRPVEVLYAYRHGRGAHVDDLRAAAGEALREVHDRVALRAAVHDALGRQPWGTHVYVCGPEPVIDLVVTSARAAGWPAARVHVERFEPADAGPRRPFTVRLARSGRTVHVPADATLLDRLRAAGVDVPHLCTHGVCGRCQVRVRSGRVEHRDLVLTDDERAAHDTMLACVSRAAADELEVDL
jgi:dimethylamine monooxygenase subunit B